MNRRFFRRASFAILPLTLGLSGLVGCHYDTIPGTKIEASPENREIMGVIDLYVRASEALDADAVLELVSKDFYENNGTSDTKDDYGFDQLQTKLRENFDRLQTLRIELDLRRIEFDELDTARADYVYMVQFQYRLPWLEPKWDTREDVDQMVLRREDDGRWRIVSGI